MVKRTKPSTWEPKDLASVDLSQSQTAILTNSELEQTPIAMLGIRQPTEDELQTNNGTKQVSSLSIGSDPKDEKSLASALAVADRIYATLCAEGTMVRLHFGKYGQPVDLPAHMAMSLTSSQKLRDLIRLQALRAEKAATLLGELMST